jgi:DNA-binding transcriptional MerR regulator
VALRVEGVFLVRRFFDEAQMATLFQMPEQSQAWSKEAFAMARHAKVLSGNKLEQLVVRLQRHSGRSKEICWRFIIQHGLKEKMDHRRWTDDEIDRLREELVKLSIGEVAKKLNRTPEAIRSILKRNQLRVREIRCDLFSVESLATALHVGKSEIHFWIDQNWLPATMTNRGRRRFYNITTEALLHLHKHHHQDVLRRGIPNQSLFEAYVQYCYSPKHTVGEQLLDVRRDKRERVAFSKLSNSNQDNQKDPEDEDAAEEGRYRLRI